MTKIAVKCMAIVLVLSSTAGAQELKADEKPQLESFKKALVQFRAGKFTTAIPTFEALAKEKGALEEYSRFYLAQALLKTQKLDDAEAELKTVLALSPNVKMTI